MEVITTAIVANLEATPTLIGAITTADMTDTVVTAKMVGDAV